jgi:hypothetical protein
MYLDRIKEDEIIERMKGVLVKRFESSSNSAGSGSIQDIAECATAYAALVQMQWTMERR